MYNADVQDLDKLNKVPREDHVWPRPKQDNNNNNNDRLTAFDPGQPG